MSQPDPLGWPTLSDGHDTLLKCAALGEDAVPLGALLLARQTVRGEA